MPRLILMRHAKSDWSQGTADIDRPLNKRGRSAVERIGQHLSDRKLQPERILCSPALRTRETLGLLLPFFNALREILFLPFLYDGMDSDYLAVIRDHGAQAGILMVIGHNSAVHETAVALAADGAGADMRSLATAFPTAATAIFGASGPWAQTGKAAMKLESYILPRMLEAGGEDQ